MNLLVAAHGKNAVLFELHHGARFAERMLEVQGITQNVRIPWIRLGN
jgi:hypothetical protein